ncbi:MAG TPA: hypothetical protein VFI34_09645 [Candidatus Limnocylindrales bacterium]|nr:hypothetical protein [Candidatus Limnocylindrales bacterium]
METLSALGGIALFIAVPVALALAIRSVARLSDGALDQVLAASVTPLLPARSSARPVPEVEFVPFRLDRPPLVHADSAAAPALREVPAAA